MDDVKIVALGATEVSIGFINRIPNTHYLRFSSPEETLMWIRSFELATQQEVKKVVKRGGSVSLQQFANSVKDLKLFAGGSQGEKSSHPVTDINKRSYIPVYWETETLEQDSFGCFSKKLQLDEYYDNHGETCVQGWRVLGGSLSDLVLWCIVTSDQPGLGECIIC